MLRWMMDNIFIRTDPAGNIKADKEKSTEKIDGVLQPLWHLTVQSVIREVMAVCTMPEEFWCFRRMT